MNITNFKDNMYWIGVENPELRVFDIIMETKKGTTYNSYLIDDEKVAIIDTVKDGYFDEFLSNIKSIIGDRTVDYIIVQHTELDHSGSLKRLIEEYPNATIYASKAALTYLKEIVNCDFNGESANGELNLGKHTLQFISAPNLHWPDTLFTYVKQEKVLFTCDVFGSHYCPTKSIFDNNEEDYMDETKYYFDVIMGPFKKFVLMAMDKINNLKIDIAAPSHGPIHRDNVEKYIDLYREWAYIEPIKDKNIAIFYVSAYGNTEKIAMYFAKELNQKGIKAEYYDISTISISKAVDIIERASGILIGSPTINQDAVKPVWDLLSSIDVIGNRGKAAAAFGSYGWSGEGVQMMTDRLKSLKFKTIDPGFRFKFVPDTKEYEQGEEFIQKYIELI